MEFYLEQQMKTIDNTQDQKKLYDVVKSENYLYSDMTIFGLLSYMICIDFKYKIIY